MRNKRNSNKMWVSLLTTVGVSAAIYGLQKYMNGKLMRPIQNMMNQALGSGTKQMSNTSMGTALAEFSNELAPKMMNTGKNTNTSK